MSEQKDLYISVVTTAEGKPEVLSYSSRKDQMLAYAKRYSRNEETDVAIYVKVTSVKHVPPVVQEPLVIEIGGES